MSDEINYNKAYKLIIDYGADDLPREATEEDVLASVDRWLKDQSFPFSEVKNVKLLELKGPGGRNPSVELVVTGAALKYFTAPSGEWAYTADMIEEL